MSPTNDAPAADLDFDAAVDAFLDTAQRPTDAGMAGAPAADPSPQGMAPPATGAAPAASAQGEPAATDQTQGEEPPVDYRALYEELQRKSTSEAASELSASGRLKKANSELEETKRRLAAAEAERDGHRTRVDRYWDDAIAAAPDELGPNDDPRFVYTKAQLRAARDEEARGQDLARREQAVTEHEEAAKTRQGAVRQQAEEAARFYALAEVDYAIGARAQHEGLAPELFQPVRDFINSPQMQVLAKTLPLSGTTPPGDPATWDFTAIDNVNALRSYLVAQAELGYGHFKHQHATQRQQAETARVAANAKAAEQTYRPEAVVGAGVGPHRKSWDQMDFDEAVDAFLGAPR